MFFVTGIGKKKEPFGHADFGFLHPSSFFSVWLVGRESLLVCLLGCVLVVSCLSYSI